MQIVCGVDESLKLSDLDKNADSDFLKYWLRGKYANTIRGRKKDATPEDFDIIGTAFHKWMRDNHKRMGLRSSNDYRVFINRDFERMSHRYKQLIKASRHLTPDLPNVFYNAAIGITLQYLPILAAVTPVDDDETFQCKTSLIASYLDLFVARRIVNYHNYGYSTIVYNIFNLAKSLRNKEPDEVREILANRVADLPDSFDGVMQFRLHRQNRWRIRYLLARMTSWIEEECGDSKQFATYVDRGRRNPYELEHIWANKFDRHIDEFDSPEEFDRHRNLFGGLVLLPKDFNASFSDKSYAEKLDHYYGQNRLVQSFHPIAYRNNPLFLAFIRRTGLPFRPYPDGFTKSDIEERQDLYRRICEQVWAPKY